MAFSWIGLTIGIRLCGEEAVKLDIHRTLLDLPNAAPRRPDARKGKQRFAVIQGEPDVRDLAFHVLPRAGLGKAGGWDDTAVLDAHPPPPVAVVRMPDVRCAAIRVALDTLWRRRHSPSVQARLKLSPASLSNRWFALSCNLGLRLLRWFHLGAISGVFSVLFKLRCGWQRRSQLRDVRSRASYSGVRSVGASSRLPILTSTSSSRIDVTRPPQVKQKLLSAYVPVKPVICSNASRGHTANAEKVDPLALRQSVQWQMPTRSGSPVTRNVTPRQMQLPVRT